MQYSITYTDYLNSKQWRQRRLAKLEMAEFKCQYCDEKSYLSVHHLSYKHLGNESTKELVVLCPAHHWVADVIRRTGNKELLEKINRPFQRTKSKKEKRKMNAREIKLLRRKKKHERKLLDKTIHRNPG